MVCKWQVEIDDYANRVLAKHWPDVPRWRDIKTFPFCHPDSQGCKTQKETATTEREAETSEEFIRRCAVDVICGGFPCQDISYAGKGAGLEGARSGLFFEAIRVVRQLRPRAVVLENVAALLGRGLDRVHGELAEIGYRTESHCLPAAAFGAPHIRDRVFILSYSESDGLGTGREGRVAGVGSRKEDAPKVADAKRNSDGRQCWAVEPDVCRVANGISARSHRLRGLGNAVVPQVAEWIGRQIIQQVDE